MAKPGIIGSFEANQERAHTDHHSPVITNSMLKSDNGTYPTGMIVSEDENGDLVPYTGSSGADTVDGVMDFTVDTATATSGLVLRHGTARTICVGTGAAAPTAAQLAACRRAGIFPV